MRELVPDQQGMILVLMFVVGNTLVYSLGGLAGADIWLAFLMAMGAALPMVLLLARIRSLLHGTSLGAGLEGIIGKWPARLLALLYAGHSWRLACYVVSDVTNFVQAVALPTTPQVVLATLFALLMLWAAKEGVEVMARFAVLMSKIVFGVLAVIFLLLLSEVDLAEFQPVMYGGLKPVVQGALQLLDFPFLEPVILVWVFDCFSTKNSPYKVFVPGFLLAALTLMIMASASLSVVGAHRYAQFFFPVWTAVGRINVAAFLTRLEAIVGISFAIGSFIKMAVCLLAASKALAYAFGFSDYRFVVTPLAMGVIPGSQWFITTVLEVDRSATATHSVSEIALQVVAPVVVWMIAEIRTRGSAEKGKQGNARRAQAGGGGATSNKS